MNKFLIACTVIVGVGGSFSFALAATSAGAPYDQPAANPTAFTVKDLPYTVARLCAQVQTLKNEVQSLQAQNAVQQDENAQDLDVIPTGG